MISGIQEAIRRQNLDGWLFFDHHHRDPLAYRILALDGNASPSRRWYYFIPAFGDPGKLVHRIEPHVLDALPGTQNSYATWAEHQNKLFDLLKGVGRIAMQYSPNCAIPYISTLDGGTLELVRSAGVEVNSSADLVQEFEARWTEQQLRTHLEAGRKVDETRRQAFTFIRDNIQNGVRLSEYQVQQFIRDRFGDLGLLTDHGPIVAVNENASDPHYEPSAVRSSPIQKNDLVLIDLWAKLNSPEAVYYDVTWTGICTPTPPSSVENVFQIVKTARQAASSFVARRCEDHQTTFGWEVDDAARGVVDRHRFGQYFFHRTGHSIGVEVHGNGANMDNYESHDDRKLIPNTCFSIEPGIYLPGFGIRSEVNVFVAEGKAFVTGEEQERLVSC